MKDKPVIIYEWDTKQPVGPDGRYIKKEVDFGWFHAWGIEYEELQDGVGNYSTAIIEKEDGTVVSIPVDLIKFITILGGE